MSKVTIKFDGACGNVKDTYTPMGIGVAVFVDGEISDDMSVAEYAGMGTSMVAEWKACIVAAKIAGKLSRKGHIVTVYSDSQVVTNQFNGTNKINSDLIPYYTKAKGYYDGTIVWIPREENTDADYLSKMGLSIYNSIVK